MAKVALRSGRIVGVESFCVICGKHTRYCRKSQKEAAEELANQLQINLASVFDSLSSNSNLKEMFDSVLCETCEKNSHEFKTILNEWEQIQRKLQSCAEYVLGLINNSVVVPEKVSKRKSTICNEVAKSCNDKLRQEIKKKVTAIKTNHSIAQVEPIRIGSEESLTEAVQHNVGEPETEIDRDSEVADATFRDPPNNLEIIADSQPAPIKMVVEIPSKTNPSENTKSIRKKALPSGRNPPAKKARISPESAASTDTTPWKKSKPGLQEKLPVNPMKIDAPQYNPKFIRRIYNMGESSELKLSNLSFRKRNAPEATNLSRVIQTITI